DPRAVGSHRGHRDRLRPARRRSRAPKGRRSDPPRRSGLRALATRTARRCSARRDARATSEGQTESATPRTLVRTAVDTAVLLDVLGADPEFGVPSREALRAAYRDGALVACSVVWAEVRASYPDDESCADSLGALGIRFDALRPEAATLAGRLWREHCSRKGRDRRRVVAAFLIGANGQGQAST